MNYMRKVIYLKKWENKIQISGQGFARLEKRKGYFTMHLSLQNVVLPGENPIYIVYEKEGRFNASLLGTTGLADQWDFRCLPGELPDGVQAEQICGIIIGEEKHYLSGLCQEYPGNLLYENVTFVQREERPSEPEISPEPENSVEPESLSGSEPAAGSENLPEEEIRPDSADKEEEIQAEAAVERKPGQDSFLEGLTEMYPFEDDEIEWCYQIRPEDFNQFPMEYWHYAKNSFLLQGFYNYRHLVYAHTKGRNYIGVPGQFIRREQYLATRFGFQKFKQVRKKSLSMGDYGYWMREL